MLECDGLLCLHCMFAPQWMPDSRPNRPQFCFVRLLIHLVGEWASNHTPGGLLGGRMDTEPCPGQLNHSFTSCPILIGHPCKSCRHDSRQASPRRCGNIYIYIYIGVALQCLLFEHTNFVHRFIPCLCIFLRLLDISCLVYH